MGQDEGRSWGHAWSARIGRNIAKVRKERGLSAQALANRCSELGHSIPRSTLANIESGRNRSMPVQEIAVIAQALGVPPVRLLYDVETMVEPVPGVSVPGLEAAEWFAGNWPLLTPESRGTWATPGVLLLEDRDAQREFDRSLGALWMYRYYAEILVDFHRHTRDLKIATETLQRIAAGEVVTRRPITGGDYELSTAMVEKDVEFHQSMLANLTERLGDWQERIRAAGYRLPAEVSPSA